MKSSILFAAVTAAALSTPAALAQATKADPAKPAMSMDMDKHVGQMQENTKMMRAMGGSMMGSGQHGGMMMGGRKEGMSEGEMMKRHEMMEKRMEMRQMMMEQMLQHDQMMQQTPAN